MMNVQHQKLFVASFFWGVLLTASVTLTSIPVGALETEPHPLDTFLTNILNFKKPTGIRGTLRYIDLEDTIIWLNWHERSNDRPFFQTNWRPVPGEATLAVHPTDLNQFNELRHFGKGAPIEMVIQLDAEGKRRIHSYHDPHPAPQDPDVNGIFIATEYIDHHFPRYNLLHIITMVQPSHRFCLVC